MAAPTTARPDVLHRAAGLVISAGGRLPGFVATSGIHRPDVRIHLDDRPSWHDAPDAAPVHPSDQTDGDAVRVLRSSNGFHFAYADLTHIWIDAAGTQVWCTWPSSATLGDTCTYLCGPVLGFVLRLRGALALHASAVEWGPGAIAFAGPHGAGKSTIAAALGAAAHRVITDDVLHLRKATEKVWLAEPFESMLRLWPEGSDLALGPNVELPVIVEGWNKRALHLGADVPAANGPLPLRAVAWLAPRGASPSIEQLTPGTALVRLAANSSASHLLDGAARAREFRALSQLVRSVPVFAVTSSADPAGFQDFIGSVTAWADALPASAD